MKPKIQYGDQYWDTYLEIDGAENQVRVCYETSPAEPDVNWGGSLDIQAVMFHGWDVQSLLNQQEREALYDRLNDYENDRCNPDNYDYPED